ncbi:MAG: hypothetical protein EOP09_04070 [Proteobacteria bacterium]|nr:MAG: hypothetical protein EOP09_04070 [Pseudomonadota bacterium]
MIFLILASLLSSCYKSHEIARLQSDAWTWEMLPPTALILSSPTASPGTVANPVISALGVGNGHIVTLHSEPQCLETSRLGYAQATSNPVLIQTSSLVNGITTIYAKV